MIKTAGFTFSGFFKSKLCLGKNFTGRIYRIEADALATTNGILKKGL
jgi:hypothetical protein